MSPPGDVGHAEAFDLGSDSTLEALATSLALTRDTSKGLLSVGVREGIPGDSTALPGVTIPIDVANEVQVVFDMDGDSGFSEGDTPLAGSSSASVFVNVALGTVTPTLTPPSGYACDVGPEAVEVAAHGYTIVHVYCTR